MVYLGAVKGSPHEVKAVAVQIVIAWVSVTLLNGLLGKVLMWRECLR